MGKTSNPAQSSNPVNPDSDDFRKQVRAMIQSANMIELREYQETLLRQVQHGLTAAPNARLMLQLPTGGGKTVIAGALLAHWLQDGRKAVWLTHRKELAEQTRGCSPTPAFRPSPTSTGRPARTRRPWPAARSSSWRNRGPAHRQRRQVWNRKYNSNDLLVIDEAHHAAAPGWERAMQQWPGPMSA